MKITWFLICLLGLVGTFGCLPKEKVKIGLLGSFSGKYSDMGKEFRQGNTLALEHFKKKYPDAFEIEIRTYDTKGELASVKPLLETIRRDGVKLILGPLTSNIAREILDRQQVRDILFLSPSVSSDFFSNKDDNFIMINEVASLQGVAIARELENDRINSLIIIYDGHNGEYTLSVREGIVKAYLGKKILKEYDLSSWSKEDYYQKALEIGRLNPQAITILASGITGGAVVQNLGRIKYQGKIYGPTWLKTSNYIRHGGRYSEGTKVISNYYPANRSREYQVFENEYQELFGSYPDWLGIYAYDTTNILLRALLGTKQKSGEELKKIIVNSQVVSGIQEEFLINEQGDAKRKTSTFIVRQGKFERITNE
ncbi:MAG: hypothetical protein A2381_15440 [Bdellovibrionales bacterium RIFOXYB1_FULL_37_110]|nr:MAG: hypothetical protein A2417_07290 [Bdellovibrionales bacterium RIFOXYC1_FULL_37_79]OFZ57016.1 MAG: hypothetical protein A2381_15440 [Bdellovibrionales bacterium RIFOXYB1_FULL_37_110]OFZ64015.1 MAG: hypothetical protein A2577_16055 [Bdellovibrionales bacterium RIFOXYD1_FULL_36_51]